MLRWILTIAGSAAGLIALVWLIGLSLPVGHVASRTVRLKQPPEAVWQVLTDYAAQATWRSDVEKIDRLPDHDSHPVWRETLRDGMSFPLETTEAQPPARLVRKIADPKLPFGGAWTYEIAPAEGGSILTITENGEVYQPIFRVVSRFTNQAASIEGFLTALARKFGEEPVFTSR